MHRIVNLPSLSDGDVAALAQKHTDLVWEFYTACYTAWCDAVEERGRPRPADSDRIDRATLKEHLGTRTFEHVFRVRSNDAYWGEERRVAIEVTLGGALFIVEAKLTVTDIHQTHNTIRAERTFNLVRYRGAFTRFDWNEIFDNR